jgi:hypothetical protein
MDAQLFADSDDSSSAANVEISMHGLPANTWADGSRVWQIC